MMETETKDVRLKDGLYVLIVSQSPDLNRPNVKDSNTSTSLSFDGKY